MTALAIVSLMDDQLVKQIQLTDDHGEPYNQYALSDTDIKYLLRSYSTIMQQERDRIRPPSVPSCKRGFADDLDDDVPF